MLKGYNLFTSTAYSKLSVLKKTAVQQSLTIVTGYVIAEKLS